MKEIDLDSYSEKIRAYFEGQLAYRKNEQETMCPYSFDTTDGRLWIEGYRSSKEFDKLYSLVGKNEF